MPIQSIPKSALIIHSSDQKTAKSTHSVSIRRINNPSESIVYFKENGPLPSQMEATYGALYNLLLGNQAPRIYRVTDEKGTVIGTASVAIPDFVEYRKLSEKEKSQHMAHTPGLASALIAAYLMEEEDLHGGNFGLMTQTYGTKTWCKIDHDRSLFSSATHKLLGERLAHLGAASSKYPITLHDINQFPDLTDADPYYWPTKNRTFGLQTYSKTDLSGFADLAKNPRFISEKWNALLQTLLIPEEVIRKAVESSMSEEYEELREQIINHFLMRRASLKMELLSSEDFRSYLCALSNETKSAIRNRVVENIKTLEIESNANQIDSTLDDIITLGKNITGAMKSAQTQSRDETEDLSADFNQLITEFYDKIRKSRIQYENNKATNPRSKSSLHENQEILRYTTFHYPINKENQKIARKALYKEFILNGFYEAMERLSSLKTYTDYQGGFRQNRRHISDLFDQCEKIKNALETELNKMLENQLPYPTIYKSEIARIARNIGQCFDQPTCDALSQDYENSEAEFKKTGRGSFKYGDHIIDLSKSLTFSKTLNQKEDAICQFSNKIAILSKSDSHCEKQKKTNQAIEQQHEQLKKITCNDAERSYRSEAYLLLRNRVREDSKINRARCQLFSNRCALSPSDKAKKIGWIIAGVLAVGALVTLSVLSLGIGGVAAAPVVAVIGKMCVAAVAASSTGIGLVGSAVMLKGGLSAVQLSENTSSFSQRDIADTINTFPKAAAEEEPTVSDVQTEKTSISQSSLVSHDQDEDASQITTSNSNNEGGDRTPVSSDLSPSSRPSPLAFLESSCASTPREEKPKNGIMLAELVDRAEKGEINFENSTILPGKECDDNLIARLTDLIKRDENCINLRGSDLSKIPTDINREIMGEFLRTIQNNYYDTEELDYTVHLSDEQKELIPSFDSLEL